MEVVISSVTLYGLSHTFSIPENTVLHQLLYHEAPLSGNFCHMTCSCTLWAIAYISTCWSMGSSMGCCLDIYSDMVHHILQWNNLLYHGLLQRLQGILWSSAWSTSSISCILTICKLFLSLISLSNNKQQFLYYYYYFPFGKKNISTKALPTSLISSTLASGVSLLEMPGTSSLGCFWSPLTGVVPAVQLLLKLYHGNCIKLFLYIRYKINIQYIYISKYLTNKKHVIHKIMRFYNQKSPEIVHRRHEDKFCLVWK